MVVRECCKNNEIQMTYLELHELVLAQSNNICYIDDEASQSI